MKFPPDPLQVFSQYLPRLGGKPRSRAGGDPDKEYSIEELAQAASTTVRNIRAYQDRGVLAPPRLRGRKGIYSDAHLARLRVISGLLERGYTINSIHELLSALEEGVDLRHIIGLETAITSPWTDEEPAWVSMTDIMEMFANNFTPEALKKAIELDLLRPEGNQVRVRSMRTLRAGAQLVAMGIPLADLLDIIIMLRGNVEKVANELVQLVATHVLDEFEHSDAPAREEFPKIANLIWRLRPLAEMAVHAELARAMEKSVTRFLADKMANIVERLEESKK
jgi:DNA-binding transcriptional MerR regulator